jgi:hypothetical protein
MDFNALLRARKKQQSEPPPREPKRERRKKKEPKRDSRNDHHKCAFDRLQEHALAPPRCKEPRQKGHTVALLFMCIDKLPFEEIWRKWMDDPESGVTVKVWVHAKYPEKVESEWVRKHLLSYSHRPEWGSIELVKAAVSLVQEALKDPAPTRFCLLSESCLPVLNLRAAAHALWAQDRSWLDAENEANNGYSQQSQFQRASAGFPKKHLWKADQWFMLTRKHAQLMNDINRHLPIEAWQYFSRMSASDEMYYPSLMACMGLLKKGPEDEARVALKAQSQKEKSGEREINFEEDVDEEKKEEQKEEGVEVSQQAKGAESNGGEKAEGKAEGKANQLDGVLRQKVTYVDW